MNNNLQELQNKLEEAKALANKLQQELEQAKKANEKYELQGGGYSLMLSSNGITNPTSSTHNFCSAGLERKTKELAESALKQIRAFSRMLAYAHEHCPEWEADWSNSGQSRYKVIYDHSLNKWIVGSNSWIKGLIVYMDKQTAEKLADDLNSGRFSLE